MCGLRFVNTNWLVASSRMCAYELVAVAVLKTGYYTSSTF